ncbi:unnamed protein product [Notodromas monacha]|uniref:Protein cornichon homolog 4 n=1 Tax=Notodromas monacha TaxID=399045 RepID=A0A7R9BIS6_9CRUS|nr:unnamed protein product [Notodromas monacha]CAG0914869.1 unnamed protein product [Notodromas monacha]
MSTETYLFVFALFDTGVMLFLLIYFVITLSDLECDYLNARMCCSKLNIWVIPMLFLQTVLSVTLLFMSHWILFLVNLPANSWMLYEFWNVPKGNLGLYDPAEIHNRGQLKAHMKHCLIRLGNFLILFFVYLYCCISAMIKDSPLHGGPDDLDLGI